MRDADVGGPLPPVPGSWRIWLALLAGLGATAAGLVLAVGDSRPAPPDAGPDGLVWLIALGGIGAAAWLVRDLARSRSDDDPVPWSDAGPIVDGVPESAPTDDPLSGGRLATTLARASEVARHRRDEEPGIDVVRPLLREAYLVAAVQGGADRTAAERSLASGSWTDDDVAAATLAPSIDRPRRSVRRRLADWLFPARAVRRRTRRSIAAVAAAADETVPPVVGADAPRTVPVHAPDLASISRGPLGYRPDPGDHSTGWDPAAGDTTRRESPADGGRSER